MPIAITIAEEIQELQRIESHLSFDMDATVAHLQNQQNTIQQLMAFHVYTKYTHHEKYLCHLI